MPGWFERLRARFGSLAGRTSGPEMYRTLRAKALDYEPAEADVPADEPWTGALMAMMEIGTADGTATVVAMADGAVSMYFSNGSAVIGAGEHAAARGAAQRFRTVAAESRHQLQGAERFPLPEAGQVRFHVRTMDGRYSAVAPEALLRTGRNPLAPLYAAGQDLITEVRLASPD